MIVLEDDGVSDAAALAADLEQRLSGSASTGASAGRGCRT